jgi:hypothetical protein
LLVAGSSSFSSLLPQSTLQTSKASHSTRSHTPHTVTSLPPLLEHTMSSNSSSASTSGNATPVAFAHPVTPAGVTSSSALGRSLGLRESPVAKGKGKEAGCACAVCGALVKWKEVSHFFHRLEKIRCEVDADTIVLEDAEGVFLVLGIDEAVRR